nr:MAG TPA: restriction alleviation protein [Bacteriophage sp.]
MSLRLFYGIITPCNFCCFGKIWRFSEINNITYT